MTDSSDIRRALQNVRLFILYRLVPTINARGEAKLDKVPTCPSSGRDIDPHNSDNWMLPDDAQMWADVYNAQSLPAGVSGFGVGVIISDTVILPNGRRLFALDIDKCRDGDAWAPHASAFLAMLPGGGVEVSVSGQGLHVFGTYAGDRPEHGTRNKTYRLELYTRLRFIACTGLGAAGDCLLNLTRELNVLVRDYFPPRDDTEYSGDLTAAPVAEWIGPEDDDELLRRAMRSRTAGSVFGGRARFEDLWTANETALARAFPPQQHGTYDASAADQALANHLAFWTGNHGERMLRLMQRSALIRSKWDRPGYLYGTIQLACGSQKQWYRDPYGLAPPAVPALTSPPLAHIASATTSLIAGHGVQGPAHTPFNPPPADPAALPPLAVPALTMTIPVEIPADVPAASKERPALGDYLTASQQINLFDRCIYIQDIHEILMPEGHTLSAERFDAEFAGYTFAVTADGQRPAKRAWEAFVFSELYSFPKCKGVYFDPRESPRAERRSDGFTLINSYVPPVIARRRGDIAPFITHLYKLLPHGHDAEILLAYFAACVQYPGEKFQWWPLIQGVEGNGKTTLSYLLEYAIGERYVHWPKAAELGSKFNSAFYGKLLVCCEDVYVSESRGSMWEALKPMITGVKLEIEGKGKDKVTREVCFNGVMNSNHKAAIRKTKNDRRIGPFFTAQQSVDDLTRDGMTEDYMRQLRRWRLGEGKEIVADYLMRYEIPDDWNPATRCSRCPTTSATPEAITHSLGAAEQEILEAIGQGLQGFRGGWIASTALDGLLARLGKSAAIPRNKRREVLESLGYKQHPALPDGRSTAPDTDGTRPYLYVRPDAPGATESSPGAVLHWYQGCQKL